MSRRRKSTPRSSGSASTLTWLHLSDLHCCEAKTGWDAARVLRALRQDLEDLQHEKGLEPDLLLFTGDAAFGELPESPITGQFEEARGFFEGIRKLCRLAPDRVFLVPGNHDVHWGKISARLHTSWLTDRKRNREDILELIRDGGPDWRSIMDRLAAYRRFLEESGYSHLLTDSERLIYARRLRVNGLDVGIAGLNSAWSCHQDAESKLWLGGEWQLATVESKIHRADVKIGLIHHPLRWLRPKEGPEDLEPRFESVFDFHLHGHEHKPWVHRLSGGTARIAAGACYARERKDRSGYNLVRLDLEARRGEVWLRRFDEDTSRWGPLHKPRKNREDGMWALEGLRCFPAEAPSSPTPPSETEEKALEAEDPDPEGSVLAAWLRHVEVANERLTAAFERRGSSELLDHVYVELRLLDRELARSLQDGEGEEAHPTEAAQMQKADLGRPRTLEEVLQLEAEAHGSLITGRWLLYGDPGAGKTTLLRHLAWKLARRKGDPWVPLFASLPWLLREVEKGPAYLDVLAEELRPVGVAPARLRSLIERLGSKGRLLLLFDGLDEVPAEQQSWVDAILHDCQTRWPAAPIVVTTRPIGGHSLGPSFQGLELLSFGEEDRRKFLARWLGTAANPNTDAADAALRALRRSRSVWELAGNPLYLTLLALLIEEGEALPGRRAELYDLIFDFLLDGKHRQTPDPIEPRPAVEHALRHLAWKMTEANRDSTRAKDLENWLWNDAACRQRLRVTRWRESPKAFLEELATKTSILAEHDGRRRDWRFWHRTFREALVAERLEEMLRSEGEAALFEHARKVEGDEGRWAEPYALLVGRLPADVEPGPDALVQSLMKTNQALGLRALATAQGLKRETIDTLLEELAKGAQGAANGAIKSLTRHTTGSPRRPAWMALLRRAIGLRDSEGDEKVMAEGWQARAAVYRRIPELLGDAQAALDLLDSLRLRTRGGNDLFFLELAMVEVGQRWDEPEVARLVERARGRIFRHVGAPPPGLFEEISIGGERKELWQEIPTGSFQMGRGEHEGKYDEQKNPLGGWDYELPQHEVVIPSAFEMAAVPVTNAQYQAFDPDHEPHRWKGVPEAELGDHPVTGVTWYETVSFCRWLARFIEGVRLPTEEEWEYACRAGTTTRYWSGDEEEDLAEVGWYRANSDSRTHRVGEKRPSPWGLYDMHGNVDECTQSPWTDDYSGREPGRKVDFAALSPASPADLAGEADATPGGRRVYRGGACWSTAYGARAAFRLDWHPWYRYLYLGFRLVRPAARPERRP